MERLEVPRRTLRDVGFGSMERFVMCSFGFVDVSFGARLHFVISMFGPFHVHGKAVSFLDPVASCHCPLTCRSHCDISPLPRRRVRDRQQLLVTTLKPLWRNLGLPMTALIIMRL